MVNIENIKRKIGVRIIPARKKYPSFVGPVPIAKHNIRIKASDREIDSIFGGNASLEILASLSISKNSKFIQISKRKNFQIIINKFKLFN